MDRMSNFLADDPDVLQHPLAATMGDLVMARQLAIIRRLERETGTSAAAECRKHFGCAPEDLSRRAAAALIQHLGRMPCAEAAEEGYLTIKRRVP